MKSHMHVPTRQGKNTFTEEKEVGRATVNKGSMEYLLISWLQSPSAVILEPPKIKSDTVSTVSPSITHEVMGPDAMIFIF